MSYYEHKWFVRRMQPLKMPDLMELKTYIKTSPENTFKIFNKQPSVNYFLTQ
jgi:hypothetical protein